MLRGRIKTVVCALLILCFFSSGFGADTILTKKNRKFKGTVVKRTDQAFIVRTVDGTQIILPKEDISRIIRDDIVLDFENMTRYRLQVRRPFLPFVVLGLATGVYSVNKYQDYNKHRQQAQDVLSGVGGPGDDYTYLNDQSKKDLAWCVVSGLFSAGSFIIAFKPMEVKVPLGRINLSASTDRVTLAFHF